jgi:hypothetical protein
MAGCSLGRRPCWSVLRAARRLEVLRRRGDRPVLLQERAQFLLDARHGGDAVDRLANSKNSVRHDEAEAESERADVVQNPALNQRLDVVGGVLGEECGALLRDFFVARRG